MEYSGRTTALEHKFNDWKDNDVSGVKQAVRKVDYFDVQWSDCPVEVEDEVRKLWRDYELGNDYYMFKWESEWKGDDYPMIDKYLKSKNVTECIIHWWW